MSGGRAPKAKGSKFEIAVCHMLSVWVSDAKRDDLFWRAAVSGGRATRQHAKTGEAQLVSGDLCAVHPDGALLLDYYFIECKHLRSLDLTAFFIRGNGHFAMVWQKCVKQALHHDKFPMLIAKQNLYLPIIALPIGHGLFESPSLVVPEHHCAVYLLSSVLSRRYVIPRLERHQ